MAGKNINKSVELQYLSNIQNSFLAVSNANSKLAKTANLVKAVVLLPFRFIQDVAHYTAQLGNKLIGRDVKSKNSVMSKFFSTTDTAKTKMLDIAKRSKDFAIKNQATLIKVTLAGAAVSSLIALGYYATPAVREWFVYSAAEGASSTSNVVPTIPSTVPNVDFRQFSNLTNTNNSHTIENWRIESLAKSGFEKLSSIINDQGCNALFFARDRFEKLPAVFGNKSVNGTNIMLYPMKSINNSPQGGSLYSFAMMVVAGFLANISGHVCKEYFFSSKNRLEGELKFLIEEIGKELQNKMTIEERNNLIGETMFEVNRAQIEKNDRILDELEELQREYASSKK